MSYKSVDKILDLCKFSYLLKNLEMFYLYILDVSKDRNGVPERKIRLSEYHVLSYVWF